MLFHVSEDSGILRFEPRPSKYLDDKVVWAIESDRLCNYLLPRDCPRVTFYAGPETTVADKEKFLGTSRAVVAVESSWMERVQSCRLSCYQMPEETFTCFDKCAGYYVSRERIQPMDKRVITNVIAELFESEAELRVLTSLWSLRDAVVNSSLQFSLIRMDNALPRENESENVRH